MNGACGDLAAEHVALLLPHGIGTEKSVTGKAGQTPSLPQRSVRNVYPQLPARRRKRKSPDRLPPSSSFSSDTCCTSLWTATGYAVLALSCGTVPASTGSGRSRTRLSRVQTAIRNAIKHLCLGLASCDPSHPAQSSARTVHSTQDTNYPPLPFG